MNKKSKKHKDIQVDTYNQDDVRYEILSEADPWESITVEPEQEIVTIDGHAMNEKKLEQLVIDKFTKLIDDARRPLMEQFQEYNSSLSQFEKEVNHLKEQVNNILNQIAEEKMNNEIQQRIEKIENSLNNKTNEMLSVRECLASLKCVIDGIQNKEIETQEHKKKKEENYIIEAIKDEPAPTVAYDIDALLQLIANHKASDLHIRADNCPMVRLDGELLPVGKNILSSSDTKKLILEVMNKTQVAELMGKGSVNFARSIPSARFRITAYKSHGTIGAAIRLLRLDIPSFEELNLPPVMKKFAELNHGLVLVTGPAGSGKSTTLSAIIGFINSIKRDHIITIEDPIEFVHQDRLSIITQREVGEDTTSFFEALKEALRQDPNVILIGEIRDPETLWTATMAAETGHLVFSSLHTHSTIQAIDRMIDMFSGEQQRQFRHLLSSVLKGVVSQRLISKANAKGRVPAVEVMVVTPTISSLIAEGNSSEIYPYIVQGGHEGMQTFTESLTKLYEKGFITKEEALYHADHPTEFRHKIEGHVSGTTSLDLNDSSLSWL